MAQTQGIDASLVVDSILAPYSEVLQVAAKYGYLSEAQAKATLEQTEGRVEQAITQPLFHFYVGAAPEQAPGPGYGWGSHGMMHGGMMGGW